MQYELKHLGHIPTPALVYYKDAIKYNIDLAIKTAGGAERLRPHVKSHKTVEIPRIQADAGITKFKTATIAETEMLAMAGFKDILWAYPAVGANIERFVALIRKYPGTTFTALADNKNAVLEIEKAATAANTQVRLMVDIDPGMHRTGIAPDKAADLFRFIGKATRLTAAGLHVYDGNNNDADYTVRLKNATETYTQIIKIKEELEAEGLNAGTIIMGGTPSFPCYATMPGVELSPGTCFLQDAGYGDKYSDMPFKPAALLITRIVSMPEGHITLDLGYKAVASDPAPENRAQLLRPHGDTLKKLNFKHLMQNEEHWVVDIPSLSASIGDILYAIPTHICPTSALYEEILAADIHGNISERWQVRSRKRIISI